MDEVGRRVLDHRDLLEHDLALGVELGEPRLEDHLGHHVERGLQPVVGDAAVDDGVLARGRRVQLAAQRVEDLGDLAGRVRRRALEQQVLDEVRDPGLRVGLVARAGADPEAERDRAHVVEPLADHALAGVELGQVVVLHGRIVPNSCKSRKPTRGLEPRDPFITSVEQVSQPVAPGRARPHESEKPEPLRWQPKTRDGKDVDLW